MSLFVLSKTLLHMGQEVAFKETYLLAVHEFHSTSFSHLYIQDIFENAVGIKSSNE